ncbi:MAG TPA: SEFIR domain-containing protein [Streptosporangiaceae bacterium]|nr:SEFIR domain-containing protein [Streptosporangiaceae bacterium]
MAEAPRVFLSYSHDSDEHAEHVLALADALCDRGIDVILDRYVHPPPAEGWPRWMDRNLDEAQFVLMVCTETYRRRVMDREEPGKGLGVRWEGGLIYNRIYHDQPSGSRFIPALLPGSEPAHIPNPVLGHTYYRVATFDLNDPGFEALYRHLTDQPATPRPDLGALTILPPRPRPRPSPGPQSPSGAPTTNVGGNQEGMSRDAAPTPTVRIIMASSPMRVICPLHGIRTLAVWQKGLSDLAINHGWVCRLDRWSYGRFSLLAFFTPWSREAKLGWLRRQYDAETHDRRLLIEKGQAPSVVAHSFGTYILGYTLLRFDFIRFNRVILCGSILPRDFPWDKLIARGQVQAVRNEFGVRDPWVIWVRWFVRGTGPSGSSGFACTHERLEQEEFDFTHGDYFGIDHMEDRWIPFLNKPLEEIPRSDVGGRIPRPPTSAPWGLYGLALTALLVVVLIRLLWARGDSHLPPALRIEAMEIQQHRPGRGLLGRIGADTQAGQAEDEVRVSARLNAPAYCYLIALHPNGQTQLYYPEDATKPPRRTAALSYPLQPELVSPLTDGVGLQAYVLVASRRPLPPYAAWRAHLGALPWQSTGTAEGVWRYDGRAFERLGGVNRSEPRRASDLAPPFVETCRVLAADPAVEAIQAWAFTVRPASRSTPER